MLVPDTYRRPLAWSILAIWLVLSGLAIWFSFHEPYRDFLQGKEPSFNSDIALTGVAGLTVVHFSDGNCPCTRFSLSHVSNLERELNKAHHIRVSPNDLASLPWDRVSKLAVSSPSVAIINAAGKLAYYGPYTDGLLCSQGNDLVSQVLENLRADENFQWMNVLGYGCFCDWPSV